MNEVAARLSALSGGLKIMGHVEVGVEKEEGRVREEGKKKVGKGKGRGRGRGRGRIGTHGMVRRSFLGGKGLGGGQQKKNV